MALIAELFPALDMRLLNRKRMHMFKEMLHQVSRGPSDIDRMMKQDQYWRPPETDGVIIDPEGCLVFHVRPKFHEKEDLHYWYSIWQVGSALKVGVILEGETVTAPMLEGQNEIETMFHDVKTELHDRDGSVMYQWSWEVPALYTSWVAREKYVQNLRHLYFRMCRIVHDGTLPASF